MTLYCESYKCKEAVVDARAGIKHPIWNLVDQFVVKEWINDKGMIS